MISTSLTPNNGSLPGLVFHQEQPISRPHPHFKDFSQFIPTSGSRHENIRSNILSLKPYEHDDLVKSISGLDGCSQFVRPPMRKMPMHGDGQDKEADYVLFGIDEKWAKHKNLLPGVMSGSNELEREYLDPSTFPDLVRIQATLADMHLPHLAMSDLIHDLPSLAVSVHPDGKVSFVSSMTDMKDLVSVLQKFKYVNESASRKQMVVPYFRWNGANKLQGCTYLSPLKLDSLATAPLKSPEKSNQNPSVKRKGKREAKDRGLYKGNSFQACEMLLSMMIDKKRNGKSVVNSVKKAGPPLPLLLTQFSATISGTGLAVMFSVIYKVASGSISFGTSNLLTSGFGVGLFWLSWAVNKLRDTIMHINKNSMKSEFEEEDILMRLDKSVNDIFFRAASLMAVLLLKFA